jgi:hypothetical protein
MFRALALLLALATPALADTGLTVPLTPAAPGAVALYLQARALAEMGTRDRDPLLVLTAARILHGLRLTDTPRNPEPPAPPQPVTTPDASALLDLARLIDAGQAHADLIDLIAREHPPAPRALRATAAKIGPGQSQVWTLTFFGGTPAELAVLGQGALPLDTIVTDAGDTQICVEKGSATAALCGFVLRENGEVTVTVTNPGTQAATYLVLTE